MEIDSYVKSHHNKVVYCFYSPQIWIGFHASDIEHFIQPILNYINFNKAF